MRMLVKSATYNGGKIATHSGRKQATIYEIKMTG